MKSNGRMVCAGTAVLLLAMATVRLPASPPSSPDVKADVIKIAEALAKGETDNAHKLAKEAAANNELTELMDLMALRKPTGKKALGVGEKAGEITPDGIEAKLMGLAKMAGAEKGKLKKDSAALTTMANRVAAIAYVAKAKAPAKDDGAKKKADWIAWCDEMAESATALAAATKSGSDDKAVKMAATKLNGTCNRCHGVFRD